MKKTICIFVCLISLIYMTKAQEIVLEKTYEVEGKAKRGFLDNVYTNTSDNTTVLSFVTRAKGNFTGSKVKVNYQNYIFDKDYNFIKLEETEEDYKNVKFKGEKYVVEGISVEPNLIGDIVLRKKRIEFEWSWFSLRYVKKVTLLDKVKPTDDSGNKFTLLKKFENDETGEVIALVRPRPTKGSTPNMLQHYLLKIDQNLKFEVVETVTLNSFKTICASFTIPGEGVEPGDEDISNADICFIFAASPFSKENKEDPHDYELWRVSKVGKVLERVEFKVKASMWNIEQVVSKEGSLYLIGPANDGKYRSQLGDNDKWSFYQIAKITDKKLVYNTTTNMDDFEAKLKKPASQKKNPAYKGKRFDFNNATIAKDGSIFIYGQNKSKDGEFQDVLMFYFDNVGVLKAQYGVRLEEINDASKKNSTTQYINFNETHAFWTVWELMGFKEEAGKGEKPKALVYPTIAKIDLKTGDISDFKKFGTVKDKPTYFLQNDFPFITNPVDHSSVFLGLNKKGNIFWFCKIAFK